MNSVLVRAAIAFAAGTLGGLANSLIVWFAGWIGFTAAVGVAIAPTLTPGWLYPRLIWGGIWGFIFLLRLPRAVWWVRGLVLSLGPSAVQMFVVFPLKTPHGFLGLGLGASTPLLVLAFNAVWGLVCAWVIWSCEQKDQSGG